MFQARRGDICHSKSALSWYSVYVQRALTGASRSSKVGIARQASWLRSRKYTSIRKREHHQQRFREISLMKELKHENILSLHDVIHTEKQTHAGLRVYGQGP